MRELHYDVVIVGCGVGGLYTALNLPEDKQILMLSKAELETCDSMLAQGGICVLRDEDDYDSYFEDTMRAGHYENRKESVDIMIRGSRDVINDLIGYGVQFERNEDGSLAYTKEGAHSKPRICFHEDITGEEITTHLLSAVKQLKNVTIFEHTTMTDHDIDTFLAVFVVTGTQTEKSWKSMQKIQSSQPEVSVDSTNIPRTSRS